MADDTASEDDTKPPIAGTLDENQLNLSIQNYLEVGRQAYAFENTLLDAGASESVAVNVCVKNLLHVAAHMMVWHVRYTLKREPNPEYWDYVCKEAFAWPFKSVTVRDENTGTDTEK